MMKHIVFYSNGIIMPYVLLHVSTWMITISHLKVKEKYIAEGGEEELEQFLSTVVSGDAVRSMYDTYIYAWNPDFEVPEYYGFLSSSWYFEEDEDMYKTPTEVQDVVQYVTEVMISDDDGFMDKYAPCEVVRKKYMVMQKIVTDLQARVDL